MATKKSFKTEMGRQPKSTAAASYISVPVAEGDAETKSKRLNLLIKPSTQLAISKIAVMRRKSTNELINNILEDYAQANSDLIDKYDATFEEV